MSPRQARYSKEEHAQRGNEIYERVVRPEIDEAVQHGRIAAIDIESEAFELGDSILAASQKLLDQHPDAQVWFVRIGYDHVHHFGLHALSNIG
jgi:hypothetical protein